MAELPEGVLPIVVVDVRVRFSSSLLSYHVHTSVQEKVAGHVVYERQDELEGTWAEVLEFLTALLSLSAAQVPVADHYTSLIS